MSKEAAMKAIKLTEEAFLELESNNKRLNDEVGRQLMNLVDKPSTKKYGEMMSEIQSLMNQLRNNFNDIHDFCDKTIRWIDEYNSH